MDYKNCQLCPRRCGVDRGAGQLGFCRMDDQLRVSHAGIHFGEEPMLTGKNGSGTVFFTGCSLGCRFCQNSEISLENRGSTWDVAGLRCCFLELIDQGAENINLVTPTHFLPKILEALTPKLPVPVVYNCGGYERFETLKSLEGLVDIYLPDFKFMDNALGKQLSGVSDYKDVAKAAILEMYRQTGKPVFQGDVLKRGTVIRHLILPGNTDNSLDVLDWVGATFPSGEVLFSLMAQYVPHGPIQNTAPFNRGITETEYASVVSWMELCGISQGFLQDRASATDALLPNFNQI